MIVRGQLAAAEYGQRVVVPGATIDATELRPLDELLRDLSREARSDARRWQGTRLAVRRPFG